MVLLFCTTFELTDFSVKLTIQILQDSTAADLRQE